MHSTTLKTARQKLQATDVPLQLRLVYFIRLSCTALDSDTLTYSSLMQALAQQQSDWWRTCSITPIGTLHSTHPAIADLLQPINRLHQPQAMESLNLPLAA